MTDALQFSAYGIEGTGVRGDVVSRPGDGVRGATRSWVRTIASRTYGFTVVEFEHGETRWFVTRFNGYPGGPRWGCAWSPHRSWTFHL